MASQPDPSPDRIDPQSPAETPPLYDPAETPGTQAPDVPIPAPDFDQPDSAPQEIPPD